MTLRLEPRSLDLAVTLSHPCWLPDGRVAVTLTTPDIEGNVYRSAIWAVTEGDAVRLTHGERADHSPKVAPDGRSLAFLSDREERGVSQVHVLPLGGGEARRLTNFPLTVNEIEWLPDSTGLIVSTRCPLEEPGTDSRDLPPRRITGLRYKADQGGFVADRRRHLFVVTTDGDVRQITDGDADDSMPAVSPDGSTIVFVSARHETAGSDLVSDVYRVAVDGGEPERLTAADGEAWGPVVTPDGEAVVYLGHRRNGVHPNLMLPFRVPLCGGEPELLTPGFDRNCHAFFLGPTAPRPRFEPGGEAFLVSVVDRGRAHLARVPAAGGQAEIVAGGDRYVTGADCGPDGIVITTSEFDRPAALSLIGRDGEQPLWDPSPGRFLRGRELDVGRPDGTSVHGFVVVPPDLAAGERAPVLLDIHGGPFSQYGLGFFDEFQIYAAAGYVVVACNPRGSDGYGLGWGEAIRGDWGNEDAADIEAFLDAALAETPEADAERIVVTGGSYGGYMTSWLVSHSDRYAAACSERAVNDLLALWAQSDIGHTFCEEVMATDVTSDPHLDPPLLRERSPLSHAASITTPLLILHAEGDQRCPVYQAEAMHTALVRLGRDVEFVLFPGESHELSRNGSPLHRAQRFEVILDFFARRLGR